VITIHQRHRQTDRQTTCDCNTALCTKVHREVKNSIVSTARCTLVQSAVGSHVVCLSVCLSVTLVDCDDIGWNSSKIISPSVSLGSSLFATQTSRVYSKGNTRNFRPNRGGVLKKWLSAYKSSNISETRQDRTKVTIEVE